MNAPDIKALFEQVRVGTRVQIINEPVKFSVEPDGKRYIEVHRPLAQTEGENPQTVPFTHSAAFTAFAAESGSDKTQIDKAWRAERDPGCRVSRQWFFSQQFCPVGTEQSCLSCAGGRRGRESASVEV